MKKKLKDTKLGLWLKTNAPHLIEKVGDILPDNGMFGLVKNLIAADDKLTPELKAEFAKQEHELQLEFLKDVQSARARETDLAKALGHQDYFMMTVGAFILLMFAFCMWVTVFVELPTESREMFIEMRATSRDALIGIVSYYWGSSAGSRVKDMLSRN